GPRSSWAEAQLDPLLLRQPQRDQLIRLADVVLQFGVAEPGLGEMLDPLQAARRKIGGRTQPRLGLEHLIGDVGGLEGEAGLILRPSTDREYLAASLPHVRSAPLDHVGRRWKRPAERIELVIGHGRPRRSLQAGSATSILS